MNCDLCPRNCNVDRDTGSRGVCGMGSQAVIARAVLHFDEEPCISGSRGSGAVFFSGCPLKCAFCQNEPISHGGFGQAVSTERLRQIMNRLIYEDEAHNINIVTGTHFVPAILKATEKPLGVPIVWNSSGYESLNTLRMLDGRVSVYMPDFKFMSPELSGRLAKAPDYPSVAKNAILEMFRQVGEPEFDDEGVMTKGLLIRHLILPGHTDDSIRVLDWIHDNLPESTYISLMAQYIPFGEALRIEGMNRRVSQEEYDMVVDHLFDLGMENGYVQELSSASEQYVPSFDLTGVNESSEKEFL